MSKHIPRLISTGVHGVASVAIWPDRGNGYVAQRIELRDSEGNLLYELTAFGDHEALPAVDLVQEGQR